MKALRVKRKSFTLVELVVVLVILAILVGLALPAYLGAQKRAYRAEALTIMNEMKNLVWGFNLEHRSNPANPAWPPTTGGQKWTAIGYASAPNTTNWGFDTTTSGGNFIMNATARTGSKAEGLGPISLTLYPNGSSLVQQ